MAPGDALGLVRAEEFERSPAGCDQRRGDPSVWYASSEEQAAQLAVSELDLVGDDCSVTQTVASAARDAGFDGVLAPAAALPGRKTLAVFAHALPSVISV